MPRGLGGLRRPLQLSRTSPLRLRWVVVLVCVIASCTSDDTPEGASSDGWSDVATSVTLETSEDARVASTSFDIDVEPADDQSWPTVRMRGRLSATDPCPSGEVDPEIAEDILTVSLNGTAGLQFVFGCDESGQLEGSGVGWTQGRQVFRGDDVKGGSQVLEFDYSNYFVEEAATTGDDRLEIRLEADRAYQLDIDSMAVSRDVFPGSTTNIRLVNASIDPRPDGTTLSIDYTFESDRAARAEPSLVLSNVQRYEITSAPAVEVVDGRASGTIMASIDGQVDEAEGVIFARTGGFNRPSMAFTVRSGDNRGISPEGVYSLGLVLLALSVLLVASAELPSHVRPIGVTIAGAQSLILPTAWLRLDVSDEFGARGVAYGVVVGALWATWHLAALLPLMTGWFGRSGRRASVWVAPLYSAGIVVAFVLVEGLTSRSGLLVLGIAPIGAFVTAAGLRLRDHHAELESELNEAVTPHGSCRT